MGLWCSKGGDVSEDEEKAEESKQIVSTPASDQEAPMKNHPAYPERGALDKPVDFTHEVVLGQPVWADPLDPREVDFTLRTCFVNDTLKLSSTIKIGDESVQAPMNPNGPTGMTGRGLLGKWGPNTAADFVVTYTEGKKSYLLVIQRGDTKEWALPGGMCEPDENKLGDHLSAAFRELKEEALNSGGDSSLEAKINLVKESATQEWRGQVSKDPRNTDNAWMQTTAYHSHVSLEVAKSLPLEARDDAEGVKWMLLTEENINNLFASHPDIVHHITKKHPDLLAQEKV